MGAARKAGKGARVPAFSEKDGLKARRGTKPTPGSQITYGRALWLLGENLG